MCGFALSSHRCAGRCAVQSCALCCECAVGFDRFVWKKTFEFTARSTWKLSHRTARFFVTTGDIPWMWLRDSSAQLMSYVSALGMTPRSGQPPLKTVAPRKVLKAAMKRQVRFIADDAYASAFFFRTWRG